MNNTVKLIIEIPKHLYDVIKNKECTSRNVITTAVENGTPLDDVKAEIKTFTITEKSEYDTGFNDAALKCFNILDNIGKESEE